MRLAARIVAAFAAPTVYLLITAVLASFLAYPIFILSGAPDISFFRSLVSRGGQAILLIGLFPLSRWLGFSWRVFGFRKSFPHQLAIGFCLGAIMLGLHVTGLLALGIRYVDGDKLAHTDLLPVFAKAAAIGIAVALMEETLFRGALLGIVRWMSGPILAVIVSAAFYAALHFIGTYWTTDLALVGWDTGFRISLDGFSHLANAPPDSLLALFLAGLLLGVIRAFIPGSLGYCVGIHAGWVFIIKSAKPLTRFVPESSYAGLVGSYDRFVGFLSSGWITLLVVLLLVYFQRFTHSHVSSKVVNHEPGR